ncbi:MAG: ATP-binding protein [Sphaerochaetaceae bacterium]|nr:ATP-binding protein [Sphaerochaetaceae bacterium]
MNYVKRNLNIEKKLSKKSVLLIGPRLTGKTSFIRNELEAQVVLEWNLLRSRIRNKAQIDPDSLEEEIRELNINSDSGVVVIDEIQKAPQLLDTIHNLIEEKGIRFLLTGSSARKLKATGVNLLGGRASVVNMHPFTFLEIRSFNENFSLEDVFHRGMLPPSWDEENPDEFFDDYIESYLQDEIAREGSLRNLPAFSGFLKLSALSSGEEINYSNIGNDIGMTSTSVSNWYQLLEDSLLGFRLQPWTKSTKRKASRTSKYYMFDVGLTRSLSCRSVPEDDQSEYGRLFENYIATELKSWKDYNGIREDLSFWRSLKGKYEVDFLIGDDIAIEVKATKKVLPKHLKGLKALSEEKFFKHRIVVCREEIPRMTEDGIRIMPWKYFLEKLWTNSF